MNVYKCVMRRSNISHAPCWKSLGGPHPSSNQMEDPFDILAKPDRVQNSITTLFDGVFGAQVQVDAHLSHLQAFLTQHVPKYPPNPDTSPPVHFLPPLSPTALVAIPGHPAIPCRALPSSLEYPTFFLYQVRPVVLVMALFWFFNCWKRNSTPCAP